MTKSKTKAKTRSKPCGSAKTPVDEIELIRRGVQSATSRIDALQARVKTLEDRVAADKAPAANQDEICADAADDVLVRRIDANAPWTVPVGADHKRIAFGQIVTAIDTGPLVEYEVVSASLRDAGAPILLRDVRTAHLRQALPGVITHELDHSREHLLCLADAYAYRLRSTLELHMADDEAASIACDVAATIAGLIDRACINR